MSDVTENPFRPGSGKLPVHRAGHMEAADCLKKHLDAIRAGRGGDIIVLFGPRGNGKTALLGEHRNRAREMGVKVVSANTSSLTDDPVSLARWLAPGWKLGLGRIRKVMGGAFGFSAGIEIEASPDQLATAMREALSESPVALVIDEAHTLPVRVGRALFQVAQDCVTDGLPLLLTMAGTPDLPSAFHKMGVSFWERCRRFRIGRLETEEAARQALTVPAEGTGYPIDEDALVALVREGQHYPYFLQMLGEVAWAAAVERFSGGKGSRRITLRDAQAGIEAAKAPMLEFYRGRRREVKKQRVLAEAIAVSEAMMAVGEGKAISEKDLTRALRTVTSDEDSLLAAEEKLSQLGLVWEMPEGHWEPGIPSLCKYIASRGTEEDLDSEGEGGVARRSDAGAP